MTRKKKRNISNSRPVRYRQKALNEAKAKYPYYILKSNLLVFIFFVGLILIVWEIGIYRLTFVPVYIPLCIWVLTGIIVTPILKKTFNKYCFNPYTPERTPIFFHYLYNIVSFGGILVFLFMWTNQNYNDQSKTVVNLTIISHGLFPPSRGRCGDTYAVVIYKNREKNIIFSCGTDIEKYSSVSIEIAKGLFGFDVITNKTLVEK